MTIDQEAPATLSHRQILIAFGGLVLGMVLAALDQTIVSTALPTIVGDLGGLARLSWVVTAYMLASTAAAPIWGKVSDLYSRKRVFQVAIVIFLIGSALCGLAQNMGELIAFRAFQGIGAGGLMTAAMAIVADLVSPRERGRYQGYIQVVFTLASVVGPLLGGFIVDQFSWRWVFYINLPIGAIALLVLSIVLDLPVRHEPHKIDVVGAALLAAVVTTLMLIPVWGGHLYAWDSLQMLSLIVGVFVLLVGFILQERRAPEPVLPLQMFRNPVFTVVSATLFITTCSLFAANVFIPMFLQVVSGESATNSGLLLLPMIVAITVSTMLSGRIMTRTGRYKIFPVAGLAMMSIGLYLLSRMSSGTPEWTASVYMVVFGLGFGMVSQVLTVAVQNSADRRNIGVATASANMFRALGGTVGVAIFGSIFADRVRSGLSDTLSTLSPSHMNIQDLQASPAMIHSLSPLVRESVVHAFAGAIQTVFLVATPIAALGLLVVLFLKELPLQTTSRTQQSAAGKENQRSTGSVTKISGDA